jgi:hypothetical protein
VTYARALEELAARREALATAMDDAREHPETADPVDLMDHLLAVDAAEAVAERVDAPSRSWR